MEPDVQHKRIVPTPPPHEPAGESKTDDSRTEANFEAVFASLSEKDLIHKK
jgi:hypothetical protein